MSRQLELLASVGFVAVGFIILSLSCVKPVQQGALRDDTGRYSQIDLSSLEVKLRSPESFAYDQASGCYFISNVNGASDAKDDNGYVIKLDSSFNLIDNYFIDGREETIVLNAPKGLVVIKEELYVCDLDAVRVFSCATGEHLFDIDFSKTGATFLNDIAADSAGNLYVSDTYQNRIYRVDANHEISVYAGIDFPNGVCVGDDGSIYVVTWEAGRRLLVLPSARIFEIRPDRQVEPLWFSTEYENLDGVAFDGAGRLLFSDYGRGIVYAFDPADGSLAKIAEGVGTPADISFDREHGLVLIPDLQGNLIVLKQR